MGFILNMLLMFTTVLIAEAYHLKQMHPAIRWNPKTVSNVNHKKEEGIPKDFSTEIRQKTHFTRSTDLIDGPGSEPEARSAGNIHYNQYSTENNNNENERNKELRFNSRSSDDRSDLIKYSLNKGSDNNERSYQANYPARQSQPAYNDNISKGKHRTESHGPENTQYSHNRELEKSRDYGRSLPDGGKNIRHTSTEENDQSRERYNQPEDKNRRPLRYSHSTSEYPMDNSQEEKTYLKKENYPQHSSQDYSHHPRHNYPQHSTHNYPQQSSQNNPQQPSQNYPQQSSQNYPQQSSQNYPQQSSQNYPQQQSQNYPQHSSRLSLNNPISHEQHYERTRQQYNEASHQNNEQVQTVGPSNYPSQHSEYQTKNLPTNTVVKDLGPPVNTGGDRGVYESHQPESHYHESHDHAQPHKQIHTPTKHLNDEESRSKDDSSGLEQNERNSMKFVATKRDMQPAPSMSDFNEEHSGFLDMGAYTDKRGSFGWYADFPVGKEHDKVTYSFS